MAPLLTALASIALGLVPPDRGDLAHAYMRFDRLAAALPKDPATRERLNRSFDGLTADFFAGRYGSALAQLARTEAEVRRLGQSGRDELAFVAAHRIELSPRAVALAQPGVTPTLTVRFTALDQMPAGTPPSSIVAMCGDLRAEVPYSTDAVIPIGAGAREGPIRVFLAFGEAGDVEVARGFAVTEPLEATARGLAARIEQIKGAGKCDESTVRSLEARQALLGDTVDRNRSASLLCNVPQVISDLRTQLAAAERGERACSQRGDMWRVYRALGIDLPTRQFVPEGTGPFPLVIAFHGAGGDENMFFDGYGTGALRELAQKRGLAVACPPTIPFSLSPRLLERYIEQIALDVPIDRTRVFLLGHSMGAIAASRLAVGANALVAGAACIAGFADSPKDAAAAPRAVYLAELDPIFAAAGVGAAVDAAKSRGLPIELTRVPHEGHTLVVGQVIAQAIDWLLARPARTTATTNPTASTPSTSPMKTGVPASAANDSNPSAGPRK